MPGGPATALSADPVSLQNAAGFSVHAADTAAVAQGAEELGRAGVGLGDSGAVLARPHRRRCIGQCRSAAAAGPGSLLAAAGAWNSLSAEYTLGGRGTQRGVGAGASGAWQAERGVVRGRVYSLAWSTQASANSAAAATQHDNCTAAAYTAALAAMPTLPEPPTT